MIKKTSFEKCITETNEALEKLDIESILKAHFPALQKWSFCSLAKDQKGADIEVTVLDDDQNEKTDYIDIKLLRKNKYRAKRAPITDVPIETYSNVGSKSPGWPFRNDVLTTHILWICEQSGNSMLVRFDELKASAYKNIRNWRRQCLPHRNTSRRGTREWTSEFVIVPVDMLAKSGVKFDRN